MTSYRGRFAPSPTGPLHAGSLVAALASWLDARAQRGTWLVRIEDTDTARCVPDAGERILAQLADCGLLPDEPPWWQSKRGPAYRSALDDLLAVGAAYPCACTRRDILATWTARGGRKERHGELVYPGTCRDGLHGKAARAWRLRADVGPTAGRIDWHDRRLGPQHQEVPTAVGDVVLLRADGIWAYQLAVVVDDHAQGITDVVRGEDLADNTPRQIVLQELLGAPRPTYLHTPLVRDARGEKLSKQHGADALDTGRPVAALREAGAVLGLPEVAPGARTPAEWLAAAVPAWARAFSPPSPCAP